MAKAKAARKTAGKRQKSTGRKKPAARTAKKRAAKRSGRQARAKSPKRSKAKTTKRTVRRKKAARATRKATRPARLLTLTEVSKRTGISMPTLQRYKKEYQDRLASVGEGRTQRYKPESLKVFKQIKKENLKKRGRPRKSAAEKAAAKRKTAARRGGTPTGLLSLSEIGRRTGISYPTLLRYVRLYGSQIPSHGSGRKRRFPKEAVPVFRKLRKQSRRGRRKGSMAKKAAAAGDRAAAARVRALDRRLGRLEKQVGALVKALKRPLVRGL